MEIYMKRVKSQLIKNRKVEENWSAGTELVNQLLTEILTLSLQTSILDVIPPLRRSPETILPPSATYTSLAEYGCVEPQEQEKVSPRGRLTRRPTVKKRTSGGMLTKMRKLSSSMTLIPLWDGAKDSSKYGRTSTLSLLKKKAARKESDRSSSSSQVNILSKSASRMMRPETPSKDDIQSLKST